MKVARELFVIPDGEHFILFLPLNGSVMRVNSGIIAALKDSNGYKKLKRRVISDLKRHGVLISDSIVPEAAKQPAKEGGRFRPTKATLFLTSDCNLRCIYCYGHGGDTRSYMDWMVARAAVDFIIRNALEKRARTISIAFHGGGEPTMAWRLLRRIVDYARIGARKHALKVITHLVTNGVLAKSRLEWIAVNIDSIGVSFDGPADIQNLQRPTRNGEPSFNRVASALKFLVHSDYPFSIKATITAHNCSRMSEMIDVFRTIAPQRPIHFEPVNECGRCRSNALTSPDQHDLLSKLIAAREYAEGFGIKVSYSAERFTGVDQVFCGACGEAFCVTPQGDVSSCVGVTSEADPLRGVFFFGSYDRKTGAFNIDYERLNRLRKRTVQHLAQCQDCFAKYSCVGDCPVRIAMITGGDPMDTTRNDRCELNRGLLLAKMKKFLALAERKGRR